MPLVEGDPEGDRGVHLPRLTANKGAPDEVLRSVNATLATVPEAPSANYPSSVMNLQ